MNTIKKILFLVGLPGQFDVLQTFTFELEAAVRRRGVETKVLHFQSEGLGGLAAAVARMHPDYIVGFNLVPSSNLMLDVIDVPFVSIFVDSITYFPNVINCKNLIACFVEKDSCKFLQALGGPKTLFLPHAIDQVHLEKQQEVVRDLDVVAPCTFYDPQMYIEAWNSRFSKKLVRFLHELADEVLSSSDYSALELFCRRAEEVQDDIAKTGLAPCDIVNSLEQYIRAYDRVQLLKAIEGADLHIFGPKSEHESWKKVLGAKSRLFLHDPVAYSALPAIFRRAKIVVNSMPMIKSGIHERLLLALSQSASVLTSKNRYIARFFSESKAVCSILAQDYGQIPEKLHAMLENEEERLRAVHGLKETLKEHFTWDVRAGELLYAMNM